MVISTDSGTKVHAYSPITPAPIVAFTILSQQIYLDFFAQERQNGNHLNPTFHIGVSGCGAE